MTAWDDLLGDLPDYLADQARSACHDVRVDSGEALMAEGDRDPAMVYVLEGKVAINRSGVRLDSSGPGEIVGEMALFRDAPRVATVVAEEPARALLFERDGYDALVAANNPVAFRIERLVLAQLGARLRRLDSLVSKNTHGVTNPYLPPPPSFLKRLRDAIRPPPAPAIIDRKLDVADVLDRSHLFQGERFTLIEGLSKFLEHFVFAPGETLCDQGEQGTALFLLAEGKADVYVSLPGERIHKLGSVGPGAAVGMTSLVDGRPRTATVIATEQVDALELKKAAFDALVSQDGQLQSALRRALIRAFAEQVDEAGANLVSLAENAAPPNAATEIYG